MPAKKRTPNAHLRHARELRGWGQKDVAEKLGLLEDRAIRRWETGESLPSPYYRQRLCTLFEMNALELGFLDPDPVLPEPLQQEIHQGETLPPSPGILRDKHHQRRLKHSQQFWIAGFLGTTVFLGLAISLLVAWLVSGISLTAPLKSGLVISCSIVLLVGGGLLLPRAFTWTRSRIQLRPALSTPLAQQNRTVMLRRLRRSYEHLLAQSLDDAAWLELGLAQQPDAVRNAATLLLRHAQRAEQLLPPGASIIRVFDESAQELLILGEPGAGKSTLLLQLASHLAERAERDSEQPLPVLLPLASWATSHPSLADWLAEQVAQFYDIPESVARTWVQANQLLPLLDGLDEMEDTAHPACIEAINAYHHAHPGPLVVCSRTAEYAAATRHLLTLQNAVVVQPLAPEQVEAHIARAGKLLDGLGSMLKKNRTLLELASTPLMLSILMVTYRGTSVPLVSGEAVALQQHVWTDYVQRVVKEKGNADRYSLKRTHASLHWLARQMREHNETVFYLEHVQPSWLPAKLQPSYSLLAIRTPGLLIGMLVGLILPLFFNDGSTDLVPFLQYCFLAGFLGVLLSEDARRAVVPRLPGRHHLATSLKFIRHAVISASMGLVYGLCTIAYGSILGIPLHVETIRAIGIVAGGMGLGCWVLLTVWVPVSSRKPPMPALRAPRHRWDFHWAVHVSSVQSALLVAAVLGGERGLSEGLIFGLVEGPGVGWLNGWRYGLSDGVLFGFICLLLNLIYKAQTDTVHLTERLRWTWRSLLGSLFLFKHLRVALFLAGIVLAVDVVYFGLSPVVSSDENRKSLFEIGVFGLSDGLSFALVFWLLVGLFQGIVPEQVADKDRWTFNQGIRRSLRNSFIMSLLSGGVMVGIGVLSVAVREGLFQELVRLGEPIPELLSGLSIGLSFGVHLGLPLAVFGGILVWTMSGGLAVLRHAVLRFLLWRSHTFPWFVAPFLEDATARILLRRVGGGYSFTHRLLLDYFADRCAEALSTLPAASPTLPSISLEGVSKTT